MKKKKKRSDKKKTVYYDDGSTIHDMSGLRESGRRGTFSRNDSYGSGRSNGSQGMRKGGRSSFKEVWTTYITAVRAMVKPLLVVLLILLILYILIRIVTGFAV